MSRKPKAESRAPSGVKTNSPDSHHSTLDCVYAFIFGLFLGLTIWKFGNPAILDQKISPPNSFSEFLSDPWPTHWANWIFFPLATVGAFLALKNKLHWPTTKWLWLLPLLWFGWQLLSATQTVDTTLTATTLWQFFGCVACYFLGAFLFGTSRARNFLLIGILAAFAFCLVRAIDQRLVEFPQTRRMLIEGERENWTNLPPEILLQMEREQNVIVTNGLAVANPVILAKLTKGRIMGTLIYPNALAGIILLLLPVSLTLAFSKKLRPAIRTILVALTIFLGAGGLFWSGSKSGWLIAMALGGLCLFRLHWPVKLKIATLAVIVIFGIGIFAARFHNYFSSGATSVGARFDYWRAAVQTTGKNPWLGSGSGTFQRPYAQIKSPDAEMARLAHNDYLEQFSDSGIPGGIFYGSWIALALATIGRRAWKKGDLISFAIFIGLLGWFVQGVGEFSLYIPALAWTAFTLLGCLLALTANPFDKKSAAG